VGLLLFQGLGSCNPGTSDVVPLPPDITNTPIQERITVYFTDPSAGQSGGPDEAVVQAIDSTQRNLDMAMYNLSLDTVCEAMIHASQRGVRVRVVTESDSLDGGCYEDLKAAGIGVLGDRREGLMHNKFFVIDGYQVWTGSLNLTFSGSYEDNNNIVRIDSSRVAEDYTNEFNEMYEQDKFGPDSSANPPYPQVTVGGIQIEVYFSPHDGISGRLNDLISGAQSSIDFLAYSFTLDNLAQAMKSRAAAGVRVRGVFDTSQIESNGSASEFYFLEDAGLDVRHDGIHGLMHHKVIIIDKKIVIFGSNNFSRNADQVNDENMVILYSPELAAQFLAEFEKVYSLAR
jgi:phosphatidylserine/phosphatidylglycerophosphate/cardiolipin synthase-like enzyme